MQQHPNDLPAWLDNCLFDRSFLLQRLVQLERNVAGELAWLRLYLNPEALAQLSEAQLEDSFIKALLLRLGWALLPQQAYTVQGQRYQPDWSLLADSADYPQVLASASTASVRVLCESKHYRQPLDSGRADKAGNPHFKLLADLSALQVRFGFLTNGGCWRLYDAEPRTHGKNYLQIDLALALTEGPASATQAVRLFFHLFAKERFDSANARPAALATLLQDGAAFTRQVEHNLQAVIYGSDGEDSLFELLGQAVARRNPEASLAEVYENALVLLFRLLFVVSFEGQNRALLSAHPHYQRYALSAIYAHLQTAQADQFEGFYALKQFFMMLGEGAPDVDLPLFNGSLFDPAKAPLLRTAKTIDNATLRSVLKRLLYQTVPGQTQFEVRRDYQAIPVTHLSRICAGLLEFRFEKALENLWYVELQQRSNATDKTPATIDGYYGAHDFAALQQAAAAVHAPHRIGKVQSIKKGDVYLTGAAHSRKTSASLATPAALSLPLVRAGVAHAVQQAQAEGRSLLDLKILDNACGSGHFLVEALHHLTQLALDHLAHDPALKRQLDVEQARIQTQLAALDLHHRPDDAQVLKRLLLKRCIYGVDLNPLAIELTRLGLWIDSFIFGTPLPFIEHHIRPGNALMGSRIAEFKALNQVTRQLWQDDLEPEFAALTTALEEISTLPDSTAHDVANSRRIFTEQIEPRWQRLSRALGLHTWLELLQAQNNGDSLDAQALLRRPDLKTLLFGSQPASDMRELLSKLEQTANQHRFFHDQIAFADVFSGQADTQAQGFDLIVGNPPWDNTQFSHSQDPDSQGVLLLADGYYQGRFKLNAGSGDGHLFGFFVEHNLGLLRPHGSLCYLVPSALMFEPASQTLRRHLLQNLQVRFFYSFENSAGLLPQRPRSTKFALLQVVNRVPLADASIAAAFCLTDPAQLDQPGRCLDYPLRQLQALSPGQWAMMELRSAQDLKILTHCYAAFAPLSPQWLDFRNELDMTNDQDLLRQQYAPGLLPLIEGKTIWQYSHRPALAQTWLEPTAFDQRQRSQELYRMADDLHLSQNDCQARFADGVVFDRQFVRLGLRDSASHSNERTLVAALIPKNVGAGSTLHVGVPKHYRLAADASLHVDAVSGLRLLLALALFNSLLLDWIMRFMVQSRVNKTCLMRLPLPQPSDAEIAADPRYRQLVRNALLLTLADDALAFAGLAAQVAPVLAETVSALQASAPKTVRQKDRLRLDTDLTVARLYGLGATELRHIVQSFTVLQDKRPEYAAALLA